MSIYDEIGGSGAVRAAVDIFYQRVLADPQLGGYFAGIELHKLQTHQRAFLTAALGGPDLYAGRNLAGAHAPLDIDDAAFDAVVVHLAATLESLGVAPAAIELIAARLAPLRAQIVTRSSVLS